MASRYPLTIVSDGGGTLVGELPTGDTLNLTTSGIYDGSSSGSTGEVLKSTGGGVAWSRAADVYLDDTQTLKNKTLESCTINASVNTITNIPNASLTNSSIEINGLEISLGGSIDIPDNNDNTLYTISVVDGPVTESKRIRLTASGSGSGTQDVFLTGDSYLSIGRTNSDTLSFSVNISELKTGSFLNKSTTNNYDGSQDVTISVDATAGASNETNGGKVVSRNSSGNFYANKIFANLEGNVTGNVSGNAGSASKLLINGANANTDFTSYQIVLTSVSNGTNSCYTDPQLVWDSGTNILGVTGGITTAGNLTAADISGDDITGDKFIRTNGLSSQFLKADGSVDSNAYITAAQAPNPIPSGTVMVFYQASAPNGWTKQTDTKFSNAALRVVTGSGGGNAGSTGFTDALNSTINDGATLTVGDLSGTKRYTKGHTISSDQIPRHAHLPNRAYGDGARSSFFCRGWGNSESPLYSGGGGSYTENFGSDQSDNRYGNSSGGANAHSHEITWNFEKGSFNLNVKYVDVIVASKD